MQNNIYEEIIKKIALLLKSVPLCFSIVSFRNDEKHVNKGSFFHSKGQVYVYEAEDEYDM